MSRSDENILGLPPLPDEWGLLDLTPGNAGGAGSGIENLPDIPAHTFRQKLAIDSVASRARYGVRRNLESHTYAGNLMHESLQSIEKNTERAKGTAYEGYHTAFNDRLVQMAARNTLGILAVSAHCIAQEVVRQPDTKPPVKKSFLQRLFE